MSFLGCPFQESNEITTGIPDMVDGRAVNYDLIVDVHDNPDNEKYVTMTEQEKNKLSKIYDDLQVLFRKYPAVYQGLIHVCGAFVSTGIHAGGVIVCREPINEHATLIAGGDTAVLPLVQYDMGELEDIGLLKIDALGLKTLDVIKMTMDLAGIGYDWYDSEDYEDASVYEMLRNGETKDVFQFANYSPTKMIADFNASSIDDLTAVNAGNRPGPLEPDLTTGKSMVDQYVERVKTGVIESIHPDIDSILADTKGLVWYQEHCIKIGQVMAGYDLGGADSRIRKTLGKKLKDKIPEIRNEFIYGKKSLYDENHHVIGMSNEPSEYCEGAIARGYDEKLAQHIFDIMEAFAKYSFNRSHALCYAVLGYKTAWLSKYYPVEFAVANCTINEDTDKIIDTLSLAKKRKIKVLPPDINESGQGFTIHNGDIRYGLRAIKGLGTAVLEFIEGFKKMESNRPFKDFDDFYLRMHLQSGSSATVQFLLDELRRKTGKNSPNPIRKDVETALILSGCFDYCEENRYKLLNHYIVDIKKENKIKIMGQDKNMPLRESDYTRKAKLALEKYYMGAYISEHPLDPFPYQDFDSLNNGDKIETTGIITEVNVKTTRRGSEFLNIKYKAKDDIQRSTNLFSTSAVQKVKPLLKKNQIIIINGTVSKMYNNITATSITPVAFKKQTIDMEDLDLPEPIKATTQMPVAESMPMQMPWN